MNIAESYAHLQNLLASGAWTVTAQLTMRFQRRLAFHLPLINPMKDALQQLLDILDHIFEEHEELADSEARERMAEAIRRAFIMRQGGYVVPTEFGMFTPEGDEKVRTALQQFLNDPKVISAAQSLTTPEARLSSFQDLSVTSSNGRTYDEYFGHAEMVDRISDKSQ